MSLHDRDYMKRPSEDDPGRAGPADEKLEAFFSGFLSRHPRLPLAIGVTLVLALVIAILAAKFAGKAP
jgi:hypothetical protein